MNRRPRALSILVILLLAGVLPSGMVTLASTTSTYHDAAFAFTYPAGWHALPASNLQQERQVLSAFKGKYRVTDIGGVENGTGAGFRAAIMVVRMHVGSSLRKQVRVHRQKFFRGILAGIALTASKVLSRSGASIDAIHGRAISFLQGAGSTKLHDRVIVVAPVNAKQLYLVYFIARRSAWKASLPDFTAAKRSMRIGG